MNDPLDNLFVKSIPENTKVEFIIDGFLARCPNCNKGYSIRLITTQYLKHYLNCKSVLG